MVFDDFFQYVPDLRLDALYKSLGALDVVREVLLDEFAHDEGLEQLQCHALWQSTLVQFEFGSNYDDRTARVVDAFAEQVLAEASLFALEHVREALELVVARSCHSPASPPVVDKCITGFLQHALLVADDDLRRSQLQQS